MEKTQSNYIQTALKKMLEGKYDVNEIRVGRYHVWMKWDGYSAMVDINYLRPNGSYDHCICHWDSLDKRIEVDYEEYLYGDYRKRLLKAMTAIQALGYQIQKVVAEFEEDGKHCDVIVTDRFKRALNRDAA